MNQKKRLIMKSWMCLMKMILNLSHRRNLKWKKQLEKKWKLVSSDKPMWARDKDDVIDAECQEFFNVASNFGHSDPSSLIQFNVEGNINFKSILCLPPRAPADFFVNGSTH